MISKELGDTLGRKNYQCDACKSMECFIIQLRLTRKLCVQCWQSEKAFNRELINRMKNASDKEPPLGYQFVMNDWFTHKGKGKKFADYAFETLGSWFSVC